MTNTPPPIAWPTIQPTINPSIAPTNIAVQNSVNGAGLGSGTIAGISIGVLVLVALAVAGFWTLRNMSKTGLSEDEESIMKRYLDVMARKKESSGNDGNNGDEEGKEEVGADGDGDGDGEDADMRRSYANSIAEIYSPRWSRMDQGAGGAATKKGPFVPYVAGGGSEGVNPFVTPASRHMSIQMTTLNRRESTRLGLNPEVAGMEESGVNDSEFPPAREYQFNPMSSLAAGGVRRVSTVAPRGRGGTSGAQSHAVEGASSEFSLQSRRVSAGALNMSMQLAGRSGALAPASTRRLSAIPLDQQDDGATISNDNQQDGIPFEGPVPPAPPVRKSAFQKEAPKGPSRFQLKK